MEQHIVSKVWVDDNNVWVETRDGLKANSSISRWQRLSNATREQRNFFVLSRFGIHWPEIDEDLSFEGIFSDAGLCKRTAMENSFYYQA